MVGGLALLFMILLKIASAGITYTVGNNLPRSASPSCFNPAKMFWLRLLLPWIVKFVNIL